MAKVILFGTGRGADIAYRYLSADTDHQVVAFTVDEAYMQRRLFHGLEVVPFESVDRMLPPSDHRMLVLLGFEGMNRLRQDKYLAAKAKGYGCISYVSSTVTSLEPLAIGENCFILEQQIFNLDAQIGDNVVMWSGNHLGDSVRVMDHCWLSSRVSIAGYSTIEPRSVLGVGATVSHNVTVRRASFVGANAHIATDTEAGGVYILPSTPKAPLDSDRFLACMRGTRL